MPPEMPKHVKKYLEDNGVDPSALPAEARETLAGLSEDEVKVLKKVGKSLEGVQDKTLVARVH